MRYLMLILFIFTLAATSLAQEAEGFPDSLSKKEYKKLEKIRAKKIKDELQNKKFNEFRIDINAPTLAQAIRQYLGAARVQGNNVILRERGSMSTASPYAAWDVDGVVRDAPPAGLDLTTIRFVKILRSLSETNKYGFLGGAGVIVVKTSLTYVK
jgi:hypothetical protein